MAEIYVTSTADSGAGSLRQAIADAADGDVILFDADVFPVGETTSILLSSYIQVNKSVSIYGGFSDGQGGYTSGTTKLFYVYREVEGVKTKVYIDDNNPALDGETVLFENVCRIALDGQNAVRCITSTSQGSHIFNIYGIEVRNGATTNGGGVYTSNTASCNLYDCTITNCVVTSNGGGVYFSSSNQNTLNDCTITGCSGNNGGGVYSASTSQNTLNGCTITDCSATSGGGGVYSASTSQNTLNDCIFNGCSATSGGGYYVNTTGVTTFGSCVFDATSSLSFANTAQVAFAGGVTQMDATRLNAATFNFADGAALTLTGAATIGAATFASEGRGYLAVSAGIDTSSATLTNIVLCAYGADVSSFSEVDGVLEWEAANPTTTVLIERADGDSWSTVTQTSGESLTLYLPPNDVVRLFDGVQFFTATAPSQRTYYYIGGAEGSFTSAADWSLRRGGVAITEPPVVAGQRFIVGDISSGE